MKTLNTAFRSMVRPSDSRRIRPGIPGRLIPVVLAVLVFVSGICGCDDDCCVDCTVYPPPAAPRGLWSITGDGEVELFWYPNTEFHLDGYRIYRSTEPTGYFPRIATVSRHATSYVDRDVRNGVTYYYTIAAFDRNNNESDLSPQTIFDTPRPAGTDLRLTNSRVWPERSGYDFSGMVRVDWRDIGADIYYWHSDEAGPWMIATERSANEYTDIQSAGYGPLDSVDWAPVDGWSPYGEVPLIPGHCYIVWTWDNHFAKFRVVSVSSSEVVIDWAYQIDRGNPELSHPGLGEPSPAGKPEGGGLRRHQVGMERSAR